MNAGTVIDGEKSSTRLGDRRCGDSGGRRARTASEVAGRELPSAALISRVHLLEEDRHMHCEPTPFWRSTRLHIY